MHFNWALLDEDLEHFLVIGKHRLGGSTYDALTLLLLCFNRCRFIIHLLVLGALLDRKELRITLLLKLADVHFIFIRNHTFLWLAIHILKGHALLPSRLVY